MTEKKLTSLIPDRTNANRGTKRGRKALESSLKKYGAGRSILIDRNGRIIAGNKTVEAAEKIGIENVIVVPTDGKQIVAVQRMDLDIDSVAGRELAYADNRVGELSLDWDPAQMLADIDAGIDLSAMFEDEELAMMLAELKSNDNVNDTEPQIDRAEELRQKWNVESGQLWQLGNHILACGDSTDLNLIERLSNGEKIASLVFDPEWDSMPNAMLGFDSVLAFCDGATIKDVIFRYGSAITWLFVWDCVSSWYTPNRPLKRGKFCCWYGNVKSYNFDGAHYGDSGKPRNVYNTRGEYNFVPDPRGKHLSDIFSEPITQAHSRSEHNHSKPIDWMRMLIANCTTETVLDPFSGSGTTLIACEQLGRRCRAVEISPGYVAVALERWNTATGKMPSIIDAGNV
jgi:hypothetical protein